MTALTNLFSNYYNFLFLMGKNEKRKAMTKDTQKENLDVPLFLHLNWIIK